MLWMTSLSTCTMGINASTVLRLLHFVISCPNHGTYAVERKEEHLSRRSRFMSMYNWGSRQLQGQFDSYRIADRLEQRTVHQAFTDDDRAFIERSPMFFLATADAEGRPDCSYKGGMPGFVRVLDSNTLAFPD